MPRHPPAALSYLTNVFCCSAPDLHLKQRLLEYSQAPALISEFVDHKHKAYDSIKMVTHLIDFHRSASLKEATVCLSMNFFIDDAFDTCLLPYLLLHLLRNW